MNADAARPGRRHPDRRPRSEQAPDAGRAGRSPGACHRPRAGSPSPTWPPGYRRCPGMTAPPSATPPTICASSAVSTSRTNPAAPAGTSSPPRAARIISALLTLRDQIIVPPLAGVAYLRIRRTPRHWTYIDRDYQALRLEMMALFAGHRHRLRMKHPQRQHFVDRVPSSGYVPSGTSPGRNGPLRGSAADVLT